MLNTVMKMGASKYASKCRLAEQPIGSSLAIAFPEQLWAKQAAKMSGDGSRNGEKAKLHPVLRCFEGDFEMPGVRKVSKSDKHLPNQGTVARSEEAAANVDEVAWHQSLLLLLP